MEKGKLKSIADKYNLKLIIGFGSYFVNPAIAKDIDIAVWFKNPVNLSKDFFEVLGKLQEIFTERDIDVVVLNRADPLLLKNIALGGKLLFGNILDFEEFYLYAVNRYFDYKPLLNEEAIAVEKVLEKIK